MELIVGHSNLARALRRVRRNQGRAGIEHVDKQVFRGENGHLIPAGTGMYRYQDVEMDI